MYLLTSSKANDIVTFFGSRGDKRGNIEHAMTRVLSLAVFTFFLMKRKYTYLSADNETKFYFLIFTLR